MTLAGAVLVVVASLALPASTEAAIRRVTVTQGPLVMEPYQVRFTSRKTRSVRAPKLDGFVVRMSARLVDGRGRRIPVRRVMLHHIVYKNAGRFFGDRRDGTCGGSAESFYGTGEENAKLRFPPGYGYRIRKGDRWRTGWMLMNHRNRRDKVYIKYTAVIDTNPNLQEVKPYWLRATGCRHARDPIFNVPGGGGRGSNFVRLAPWRVPVSGRIIAANSHVHGGAKAMAIIQPRCANRLLVLSRPRWGLPTHPYYRVLPVLHEPGPIGTDWVQTARGIPVHAGETLGVGALYDNERLHTRVMGIMHVYIAPFAGANVLPTRRSPARGASTCEPLPGDVTALRPRGPGRDHPPAVTVPLTGLDAAGRARRISRPPGPVFRFQGVGPVTITARDDSFSTRNVQIRQGASIRWRSRDRGFHDITVASGPVGFASLWLRRGESFEHRFDKAGTYRLYCSLHPIDMTQRVEVRPPR